MRARFPAHPDPASTRGLLAFALPLVLTQAACLVNQLVDLWVVGHLGAEALGAVGVSGYALLLPASLGLGLASAVRTLAGQARGAGHGVTALRAAWCGVACGLVLGLLCLALGPAVAAAYFDLLGHAPAVRLLEGEYLAAAIHGLAPHMVTSAVSGYLVGTRRPWRALSLVAVAVLVNLALDFVLVFGLLGLAPLGVRGAGLAGVWASALAAVLAVRLLGRETSRGACTADEPVPHAALLARLWKLGVPAGLQEALDVLGWGIVLPWLVGLYGTAELAAVAVILRVLQLGYQPCLGVGAAVSALVAGSIGAGERARARRQVNAAFALVAVYSLVLTGIVLALRGPLLGLFASGDGEVLSIGSSCLAVAAAFLLFEGMVIVYGDGLRGAGDNRWQLLVNLGLCAVVLLGGGLAAATWMPHAGAPLIWLADGLYVLCLGLAVRSRWLSGAWQRPELPGAGAEPASREARLTAVAPWSRCLLR